MAQPWEIEGYDRGDDIDDLLPMAGRDPKEFLTPKAVPFGTLGASGNFFFGPIGLNIGGVIRPYLNDMVQGNGSNERIGRQIVNGRLRFTIQLQREQLNSEPAFPPQAIQAKIFLIQDMSPPPNGLAFPSAVWTSHIIKLFGLFLRSPLEINELLITARSSARILWDKGVIMPADSYWRPTYNYQEFQETLGSIAADAITLTTTVKEEILGYERSRDQLWACTDEIDVPGVTQYQKVLGGEDQIVWGGLYFVLAIEGVGNTDCQARVWSSFYYEDD